MHASTKVMLTAIALAVVAGGAFLIWNLNQPPVAVIGSEPTTSNSYTTEPTGAPSIKDLPPSPPPGDVTAPAPTTSTANKNAMHLVTLKTNYGEIQFETYDADAPKAVNNFITLAKKGFYDKLTFHRIIKGFMIQGGDPNGNGTGGPNYTFEDELDPTTASYKAGYQKGVVAMANAGPNTNGSQFFIMLENYPLPNNYTIFGKVVKGQDVVDTIGSVPTGAQDRPQTPVTMESVVVSDK